jgi:photosystem II stability/assembly factor-like uncharacterized protein
MRRRSGHVTASGVLARFGLARIGLAACELAVCGLAVAACSGPAPSGALAATAVAPTTTTASATRAATGPATQVGAAAQTTVLSGSATTGPTYTAVAFPAAADGWLLGQPGASPGKTSSNAVIWHTSTAGATWQVQWRGTGIPLSLTATDAAHAWALVGDELLKTTDGGQRWHTASRLPQTVRQVQFVSPAFGLATSDGCVATPSDSRCPGKVLISHDGGATWQPLLSSGGALTVTADAAGQLWAAEAVLNAGDGAGPQVAAVRLLTSLDGGHSWRQLSLVQVTGEQATPNVQMKLAATASGLSLMSVFDQQTCAMHGCGTAELLQSGDGGYRWAPAALPSYPAECGYNEMQFSVAPDGTKWAATGVNLAACSPPGGLLFRESPAGEQSGNGWARLPYWQLSEASSLAAVSSDIAYAISDWTSPQGVQVSVLARTENGGRTWTELLPALAPTGQLDALSPTTALGAQDAISAGAVLRSTDSGRSWHEIAELPGVLIRLDFTSASDGIAVTYEGGSKPYSELWRSTDGGLTWSLTGRLPSGAGSGAGSYGPWMAADGHGVLLTAPGMIPWNLSAGNSGPISVWTTSDWGANWTQGTMLPLDLISSPSFAVSGAWTGWLASAVQGTDSLEQVSAASGHTVTPIPNAPAAANVQLLSPGTGVAWQLTSVGQSSTASVLSIWRTTDNGGRWQQARTKITTALPVLLYFSDSSDGWLVSGNTTWLTVNGGRTWVRSLSLNGQVVVQEA